MGQQSAFTNTSVFDKEYLEALFGGSEFPNGEFMVDYLENIWIFKNYTWKLCQISVQKICLLFLYLLYL